MTNVNISSLKKNLSVYFNRAIEFNDVISVNTSAGNAVIISESDYNALMETMYLSGNPDVKGEIIRGLRTPIEECVPENEVEW